MILCFWDKNTRKLRNFKSLKKQILQVSVTICSSARSAQDTRLIAWHLSSDYNRFANQYYFQCQLDATLTAFSFHKRAVESYLSSVLKDFGTSMFQFCANNFLKSLKQC